MHTDWSKQYGKLKKRLSQIFLKDKKILGRIASLINGKTALEIGAGDGRLSKMVKDRVSHLYLVEIDKRFCHKLKEIFPEGRVEIICKDFLQLNPFPVDVIYGNIPYHISSKILFKLKDWEFSYAVLMFQKEFAEKMLAKPGDKNFGRLSIKTQLFFKVSPCFFVSKKCFFPIPEVDSMVVKIEKRKEEVAEEVEALVDLIFTTKNKMLRWVGKKYKLKIPKELEEKRVKELSIREVKIIAKENADLLKLLKKKK